MNMERLNTYKVKTIFTVRKIALKTGDSARHDFDGHNMRFGSQRYTTFYKNGTGCVECGIEGEFFAKERHTAQETPHLNLYAIDENGEEVLMTKDHIIPESKGGANVIENYQPMCAECNQEKADSVSEKDKRLGVMKGEA